MEKTIKFSIENKQFVRVLKTATKVINRKNALPILSDVKLTMQDGRLTMMAALMAKKIEKNGGVADLSDAIDSVEEITRKLDEQN